MKYRKPLVPGLGHKNHSPMVAAVCLLNGYYRYPTDVHMQWSALQNVGFGCRSTYFLALRFDLY